MREYITKVLHEDEDNIIGTNGQSIIIGKDSDWIVLDKTDIRKIAGCIDGNLGVSILDNISLQVHKDELLLSQPSPSGDNVIAMNKFVFTKQLMTKKI